MSPAAPHAGFLCKRARQLLACCPHLWACSCATKMSSRSSSRPCSNLKPCTRHQARWWCIGVRGRSQRAQAGGRARASQTSTTESAPHQASCSGGTSDCVANSLRFLAKSAVSTTRRPSAVKTATNCPPGATAIAWMGPTADAASAAASASTTSTPSPAATSTCSGARRVRRPCRRRGSRPAEPRGGRAPRCSRTACGAAG